MRRAGWNIWIVVLTLGVLSTATLAPIASYLGELAGREGNIIPLIYGEYREAVGEDGLSYFRAGEGNGRASEDGQTPWEINAGVELFSAAYTNEQGRVTVKSATDDKLIAPGTSCEYEFKLKNPNAGSMKYAMNLSCGTGTGQELPVQVRLRSGDEWILGGEDAWVSHEEMRSAEESGVVSGNRYATYTLEWKWPYESDTGDALQLADARDTKLGNAPDEFWLNIEVLTTPEEFELPVNPPDDPPDNPPDDPPDDPPGGRDDPTPNPGVDPTPDPGINPTPGPGGIDPTPNPGVDPTGEPPEYSTIDPTGVPAADRTGDPDAEPAAGPGEKPAGEQPSSLIQLIDELVPLGGLIDLIEDLPIPLGGLTELIEDLPVPLGELSPDGSKPVWPPLLGLGLGFFFLLLIFWRRPVYVTGFLQSEGELKLGRKKDTLRPNGRFVFPKAYMGKRKLHMEDPEAETAAKPEEEEELENRIRLKRKRKVTGIEFETKDDLLVIYIGKKVKAIELYLLPDLTIRQDDWAAIDKKHNVITPEGVTEPDDNKENTTPGGLHIDKDGDLEVDIEETTAANEA